MSFQYVVGGGGLYSQSSTIIDVGDLTLIFLELGFSIHARSDFSIRGYGLVGGINYFRRVESSGAIQRLDDNEIGGGGGLSIVTNLTNNWIAMADAKVYSASDASVIIALGVGYRF